MKNILFLVLVTFFFSNLNAQNSSEKPVLSQHEIGLSFGSPSAAGNGIMVAYNRFLSENHILRFRITPTFSGGGGSFSGGVDFWNEYRRYIGNSSSLFISHGLSAHVGDRNRSISTSDGQETTSKFAAGLGYGVGFGKIINERLTFMLSATPSINYLRSSGASIKHEIKPDIGLSFGVSYRFK